MKNTSKTWNGFFHEIQNYDYSESLHEFLDREYNNHICYPPRDLLFNAFKLTPLDKVKVVIIGQDPYHEPGQAMGLSFSVPKGIKVPPSLVNIYKEISNEYKCGMNYENGDLTYLAKQGVFLLNTILTVREGQYADTDIVLPENIRITYKSTDRYDTEQSNDIYKIGSRYVLAHDNVPERYYIVNPNKSMYTFMYNKDGGVWRNRRERDADQYDNLMNNLLRGIMNDETDEYVSKEASNVTIGGVEYDSTKYTYVLSDDIVHTYNWINTTDFAFAATTERHYPFKYLTTVTAIDQTVTQFPAEFNLPE